MINFEIYEMYRDIERMNFVNLSQPFLNDLLSLYTCTWKRAEKRKDRRWVCLCYVRYLFERWKAARCANATLICVACLFTYFSWVLLEKRRMWVRKTEWRRGPYNVWRWSRRAPSSNDSSYPWYILPNLLDNETPLFLLHCDHNRASLASRYCHEGMYASVAYYLLEETLPYLRRSHHHRSLFPLCFVYESIHGCRIWDADDDD